MEHVISLVANDENFGGIISQLVGDKIDVSEVETEREIPPIKLYDRH